MLSSSGEDYQRIEFGVDEVMEAEPAGAKDPLFKVSSTLNPQAPEFILGCQPSQKALQQTDPPVSDLPDGGHYNSQDGPDSEPSAMDSMQSCQDMDGPDGPGGLGQRERKKKKKRPPGYYNYLEGAAGNNNSGGAADGTPGAGLVNGHALSSSPNGSEDMAGKTSPGAELSAPGPVMADQRTCDSPDESSLDFTSGAASLSDGHNAASSSSSSSSHSGGGAEGGRTAEQQPDHLVPESPELVGSGRHSPRPASPSPPSTAVVAPPAATATATTEQEEDVEEEEGVVANGLTEPEPAVSADGHREDSETGEQAQEPALSAEPSSTSSPDSEARPVGAEQTQSPAPPAAPAANPPKSWASLFHNSKPLPGGPQGFVEVKNVVEVVAPSPATPEQPEKAGEVKESPVHVSEDPMAPKLAGSVSFYWVCHRVCQG